MKFDRSLFLKWIDLNNSSLGEFDYNLVDRGVLVAFDGNNNCEGFTVLETRSFDESFVKRLQARALKPEFQNSSFKFYIPSFQRHRVEKHFSEINFKIDVVYTSFVNLKKINGNLKIRSKLKVINVDDSPVILKLLSHIFSDFESAEIVEQISDSTGAAQRIKSLMPDVVTMDIQMPEKTGVDVVRELLKTTNIPVIMVSSLSYDDGPLVFDALNSGAFDYIQKPKQEEKEEFSKELSAKLLAAVDGIGKHSNIKKVIESGKNSSVSQAVAPNYPSNLIWCLGASTGGTQALTQVFTLMPSKIPPTLIVQHIPPIFSKSFAESLNNLVPFTVKEAEDGEVLKPNHVYIAAGGKQMKAKGVAGSIKIHITDDPPVNRFKPSVDYMFESVCELAHVEIVAGILTGMGNDGAEGLLKLKQKGAFTFAQDEHTSAVYGMPRVAAEKGAALKIVPLDQVAQLMLSHSSEKKQNFKKSS